VKKRPAASRAPMGITPPGKDYGSLSLSLWMIENNNH
jgi:hypothetical protein